MGIWDFFKTSVFVSYDYDHDKRYKNLLVAWDKNGEFAFSFHDRSVDVSVNSTKAGPIRRVISQRIKQADRFLCLVGEHTASSTWVAWEIEKAKELRRPLVVVKIARDCETPAGLLGAGASWARSFTLEGIKRAIDAGD